MENVDRESVEPGQTVSGMDGAARMALTPRAGAMRIAMVGAGGVGGYFGARLAAAGQDVWFVARGPHLAAMRADGLRLTSIEGNLALPTVNVTSEPTEVGPCDAVFVAVKTWQLSEAVAKIRPLTREGTVVVPLLNGVEAADELSASLGRERVLKGLTRILSFIEAPGHIRHAGAEPHIALGEWDNRRSDRAERLETVLRAAGVNARIPDDIDVALWEKFTFVVSVGGVGAVTRAPIGQLRTLPETRALLERAMHEVVAVGRARGVAISDGVVDRSLGFIDSLPEDGSASLQRDIAAGRPSELDAWNGAVVRLGAAAGVATPVHSFIHASLVPSETRARGEASFLVPGQPAAPRGGT